jgi:NADH:quinone reductase (non-electrogenic)
VKQMEKQNTKVVIIGAGYAGMLATVRLAARLRRVHTPADIILVNASDLFVERLRLHQFAAKLPVKQRPISNILRGTQVNFVKGYVSHIDIARRMLDVQTETGLERIPYDNLVYALGSTIDRDSVPGVRDYAYTLTPAGPMSAVELREKLPALDQARGRLVVSGAGATGIEAAAEFAAAFPHLRVSLLTRSEFGHKFGQGIAGYMRKSLERLGVMIQEHTAVTKITLGEIHTISDSGASTVPYDLCLWAGGFVAPPLARESGFEVNEHGQILVDPFLRAISHPEVYAVGDAAYPVEEPGAKLRMAALTATIMGAHGADSLSDTLRGRTPQPFSFAYLGQGIALGPHNAIGFNNYPDDLPRHPYFTGRLGYEGREFFVRYLANMASFERRLPGQFFWLGKGRYAAAQRRAAHQARVESTT